MVLITSIFILLLALLGYARTKNYIAPTVLSPLSWGAVLFLYATLDHGMQDLSNSVLGIIVVWNLSLLVGAWFFSEVALKYHLEIKKRDKQFNQSIRSIYYWISVLGTFPLLYIAYKQGSTLGEGSFFFNLRMANTGIVETDYNYGIWQYVFTFSFVAFLIELFSYQKGEGKKRIYILLVINLVLSIVTMAKSSFFFLFLCILFSIMFRKKIATRNLLLVFGVLFLFLSLLQLLRTSESSESNIVSSMFYTYTFGGMPALDEIIKADSHSMQWGQMTMRFFRTLYTLFGGEALDLKNLQVTNDTSEKGYFFVPLPTNVYTVIGPFWLDFGYVGVVVYSFIIGSVSGFLYRIALNKELWAVIAYSFFACTLVLQFFGEYIFTNLSYTIQIMALTFFAFKFKYTFKW